MELMQQSEYHLIHRIIQVLLSLFTLCVLKCYVNLIFQTDKASRMAFHYFNSQTGINTPNPHPPSTTPATFWPLSVL